MGETTVELSKRKEGFERETLRGLEVKALVRDDESETAGSMGISYTFPSVEAIS